MTIDVHEYVGSGSGRAVTVGQAGRSVSEHGRAWFLVEVTDPSREEWQQTARALALPEPLERLVEQRQLNPLFTRIERYTIGVAHTLRRDMAAHDVVLGDVMVAAGPRVLLVVRVSGASETESGSDADGLATYLTQVPDPIADPTAAYHAAYRQLTTQYRTVVAGLAREVDELEQDVLAPGRRTHTDVIHRLTRQLIYCRRAIDSMQDTVADSLDDDSEFATGMSEPQRHQLRLLRSRLQRIDGQVQTLEALLASIMNAEQGNISVRQNDDMRKISAYVALAAVPTLLAGIYGMNFVHMPELHWRIGYPLVIVVMLVVCAVLARNFRKYGWL